jgi:hypothetical protein
MVHEQAGHCDFCGRGHATFRCQSCLAVLCSYHRACPCCDGEPGVIEDDEDGYAEDDD